VWDPHDSWNYKRGGTLDGHTDSVSCMTQVGPYLLSGGHDKQVCVSRSVSMWHHELTETVIGQID
jgi:hypothetical protein